MNHWTAAGLTILAAICPSETGLARGSSWSGNGPFGGYIASLATAPTNPLIVFAGTSAGVYKSVDGGHSWTGPVLGIPPTLVSGLAIDASNSEKVFAAVGSPFGEGPSWGLYRSTNGGLTWDRVLPGGPFTAVTIDFRDTRRVYAGPSSNGELLRSIDGGETWTAASINATGLTVIEVSPNSGSIFVVGGTGVYRSDDDGNSWVLVSNSYVWYSMTVLPTTPETILLGDIGGTGISKSTDGGKTWKFATQGLPFGPRGACNRCTLPITALETDPADPLHVFAGLYGGGAFTSSDGGERWTPGPSGVPPDAGVLSFAFPPQSTLIGTAEGGVYALETRRAATPSNEGLKASVVYGIAVTPSSHLLAATGVGIFQSSDRGSSWTAPKSLGSRTYCPGIWAHPSDNGLLFAASGYGGLLRSEDEGQSWDVVVEDRQFLQVTHVGFDPQRPNRIFAGTAPLPYEPGTILESNDYGATWDAIKAIKTVFAVLWVGFDSFDDSVAFASLNAAGLLRSTDHGATWSVPDLQSWDANCLALQAVVVNPWGEHAIYTAGMGRIICRSDDSGLTFHAIAGGNSNRTITALLADPLRPGTFYAASTFNPDLPILRSILVTSDRGTSWSEIVSGFPGTKVLSMALDASSSTLFAGTAGSGVISISLPAVRARVNPAPNLPPPIARRR